MRRIWLLHWIALSPFLRNRYSRCIPIVSISATRNRRKSICGSRVRQNQKNTRKCQPTNAHTLTKSCSNFLTQRYFTVRYSPTNQILRWWYSPSVSRPTSRTFWKLRQTNTPTSTASPSSRKKWRQCTSWAAKSTSTPRSPNTTSNKTLKTPSRWSTNGRQKCIFRQVRQATKSTTRPKMSSPTRPKWNSKTAPSAWLTNSLTATRDSVCGTPAPFSNICIQNFTRFTDQ